MSTLPVPSRNWGASGGPRAMVTVAAGGGTGAKNKRATIALAHLLESDGGFTMVRNSNSLTVSTSELWPAGDATAIVGAAPGLAHSWRLTGHPTLGQLVFDKDSNSDGGGGAPGSVWWSQGSLFTGGTTANRPTATDEIEITSASTLFNVGSSSYDFYIWRCDTVGQESVRLIGITVDEASGPDVLLALEKGASTPAAWSSKILARYHSGGNGNAAARTEWASSHGWVAVVGANTRNPVLIGDTAPSAVDVDGDKLLVPVGLNDATDGRLGFVDDWHIVHSGVAFKTTYSSDAGVRRWLVLGGSVWPWGDFANLGGSNVAGAKLLVNYLPTGDSTPPVVTAVTPTGQLPGTRAQAKNASITWRITDTSPGLVQYHVDIRQAGGKIEALYRANRGGFVNGWSGSITAISGGFELTVQAPAGGWSAPVSIITDPVDADGNVTA